MRFYCIFAALCLFLSAVAAHAEAPLGSVSSYIGKVFVHRADNGKWAGARVRMRLRPGDAVVTKAESRCEIRLSGDRIVRFDENSTVRLGRKESTTVITSAGGSVWSNVRKLVGRKSKLHIATPTAIAAVRGTIFNVDADTNSLNYLVFRGKIAVTAEISSKKAKLDSTFEVGAGQRLTLVNDFELYMKQQERVMQDFVKERRKSFEEFQKRKQRLFDDFKAEQQKKLQAMLNKEREAFSVLGDLSVARRPIDEERVSQRDWIAWNRERDEKTEWAE